MDPVDNEGADPDTPELEEEPEGSSEASGTITTSPSSALAPWRPVRLFDEEARGELPAGMATDAQFEVFRELRTRILLLAAEKRRSRFTTLVVPVTAGSGASFVARNLAATFTLREDAVSVLIDCDFRHPSQNVVLDVARDGDGLSEHLDYYADSPTDLFILLKRMLRSTPIPRLYLIPAGRCEAIKAGRPREYFSSHAMYELMHRLTQERCFVFLDGPPVTGSPDARILSEHADYVLLVVGYGQNSAQAVAKVAGTFDRAKLIGVVFNERAGDRG